MGSEHAVLGEEAQAFEVLDGGGAGALAHQLLLVRTLGHVDVQHQAGAARLLGRQPEQLVGAGVGGVRTQHRLDSGAPARPALGKAHAFLHLALRGAGLPPVQHGPREPGSDPGLLDGAGDLIHVREVIGEPGDAVLDHLEAAGQGADVHVLIGEESFDAPHPVEEALPRDVGGVAAKQGGGGMGVRIDESGEDRLVAGVQRALCAISRRQLLRGTDLDQSIALDGQRDVLPNAVVRIHHQAVCDEEIAVSHGDWASPSADACSPLLVTTKQLLSGTAAVAGQSDSDTQALMLQYTLRENGSPSQDRPRRPVREPWLITRHCRSCKTISAPPA